MTKFLKIIGIVATVLVGLAIIVIIALNLIPGKYYKGLIASAVKSATGRELSIDGDLHISLASSLAFRASSVKFTNVDWGFRPHMVTVKQMAGEMALFPLLQRILDVSLIIDSPDVLIEIHESGRGNWQFRELAEEIVSGARKSQKKEGRNKDSPRLFIRKLQLTHTRLAYIDNQSGRRTHIESPKLLVKMGDNELVVNVVGKYNGIPVALTGGIGRTQVVAPAHPAIIKLNGNCGDIKLALLGKASQLKPSINLNAAINLDIPTIAAFTPIAGRNLPDIGPLSMSAQLSVSQGRYALSDLNITLKHQTLTAEVKGAVTDLVALDGLNLIAKADTKHLAKLIKTSGYEPTFRLPDAFNGVFTAKGNLKSLSLDPFRLQFQGNGWNAIANGKAQNIVGLEGIHADVSLETQSQDILTQIIRAELPPLAPIKATIRLDSKEAQPGLMQVNAKIDGKMFHADIDGAVDNPLNLNEIDVAIDLGIHSLAWLPDYFTTELPPLETLTASARIASRGDTLEMKNIKAHLIGKNLEARAAGSIRNLLKGQGINTIVHLDLQSLAYLSKLLKTKLDPLESLKASAGIAYKGGQFELRNLKADLAGKGIQAHVAGSMDDMLNLQKIKAAIKLDLQSLALLSNLTKTELPRLGPVTASANITSQGPGLELKVLKANLAGENIQADITGSVNDLLTFTGINAHINLAVNSLASLDYLVKRKLPESGPIRLKGRISAQGDLKSPLSLSAAIQSKGIMADFNGRIAEPLTGNGVDMTLTAEADTLQNLGKLAGIALKGQKPFKLKSKIATAKNTYQLSGLHIQVGEMNLQGAVGIKLPQNSGGRPRFTGKIHIDELDLSKYQSRDKAVIYKERSAQGKPDTANKDKPGDKKLFSSRKLPFKLLRGVDADLALTVTNLTTLQMQLEEMTTSLILDNGLLSVKPVRANVGRGLFKGYLTFNARNHPALLRVDAEMTDATFRNFGGTIHSLAVLSGKGDSIATLMAGLNGIVKLEVRDAIFKKSFMTNFGSGLLTSLNPFRANEDKTELNCAIIMFDINDGVADAHRKIAAQMTDVTWLGGGEINLKTEELDFSMSPKPRKGLGITLGNWAKLVHIGGTLAQPQIELDPLDLALQSGKIAAALATGGITTVADLLWSKIKSNSDVCVRILEEVEKKMAKDREAEE